MSWADGKVNHSAETWTQSHLTLQLLKSVPFQARGVLLKLSSYNLEVFSQAEIKVNTLNCSHLLALKFEALMSITKEHLF